MSGRIFRAEALRRHAAPPSATAAVKEVGGRALVLLWCAVAVLTSGLAVLTALVLRGGG
ncbi:MULTISPECIES: hypothetical protein [unclassified Microbispora]|uniref:hypothetical protein n=1 Tax=unclassified Microbispora TaxID=2614687 RepID=UPI001600EBF3|nr:MULTISPECIES: hypothetical protein [unclassified Microbispora]